MAISLPDACQLPDQVLGALRLCARRGSKMGLPHADVARMLGVGTRKGVARKPDPAAVIL